MNVYFNYDSSTNVLWMAPKVNNAYQHPEYVQTDVYFQMPDGWSFDGTHPDLLALSAIIMLHRFVDESLYIDLSPSTLFRSVCKEVLPYVCSFAAGPTCSGRLKPEPGAPGLAFSGGVDSTACLAVMPDSTKAVFLERAPLEHQVAPSIYEPDSAIEACAQIARMGFYVYRMRTNIQYIRQPVSFPLDWATGIPAILLADNLELSSVSFGMVAESGYRVGHLNFVDVEKRNIYKRWQKLFVAAGLFLSAPVGGLTEVGTSTIVLNSSYKEVAQSCIRGKKGSPCMNCFKCFRKHLLDETIQGRNVNADEFERLALFRSYEKALFSLPVKHENIFKYIFARQKGDPDSGLWSLFKLRFLSGQSDLNWMSEWYPRSENLVAPEHREFTKKRILEFLPEMTDQSIGEFQNWDLRDEMQSQTVVLSKSALAALMKQMVTRNGKSVI